MTGVKYNFNTQLVTLCSGKFSKSIATNCFSVFDAHPLLLCYYFHCYFKNCIVTSWWRTTL